MESKYLHLSKIVLLLITVPQICKAHDITLSVFTVTSKSMTVRWSGHTGASSYKITATPKNSPDSSVFAQFSGSTVMGSVNSLSPNTVYRMRVEAMDNAVNVLSSAETEETTAPEVPFIHQAYSKHSDSITVEFGVVSGATSYIIRAENEDGYFSESLVDTSPGTVVGLLPYTQYTLSVMSVNTGGRSQPSLTVNARTVLVAPDLFSSSPSSDIIVIEWNPVDHAVLYSLVLTMEGSDMRVRLNTSETNLTFTGLQPGTTYSIKGNAWDPDGNQGDDITVSQITRKGSSCPGRCAGSVDAGSLYRSGGVLAGSPWCRCVHCCELNGPKLQRHHRHLLHNQSPQLQPEPHHQRHSTERGRTQ
ncbi:hypothetical protein cypCar_00023199 [Cyprinus carpio]|nr:hypothetical protein cypCar_00023199 [Cyprinus carpio]